MDSQAGQRNRGDLQLLTIGSDWDKLSPRVEALAEQKHLRRGKDRMDFATSFSDPLFTKFSRAHTRRPSSLSSLGSGMPATVATMKAALRGNNGRCRAGVPQASCAGMLRAGERVPCRHLESDSATGSPDETLPPVLPAMAEGKQRTRPPVARLPALLGECFDSVGEDTQPRLREALRVKPSLVAESLEESRGIG